MKFSEALKTKILVSDGAMGTMLQQWGLAVGECPEEWNVNKPDILASIHKDYFEAGADIVETNSFGGNKYRLQHFGLESKIYDLNFAAAKIAKDVCPAGKYVAGSVGPTGEFLQPLGTGTTSDFEDAFSEQIQGLADGGVDVLSIETMSFVEEIIAAVNVAQQINRDLPLITSMTFEKSAAGYRTMMGISIEDFVKQIKNQPVVAIGANCGKGADEMIEIMREFRQHTDLPLLSQANAGLPEIADGKIVYRETPQQRGELTQLLLGEKVNIIGGCCGTGPGHIRAIKDTVDLHK